MDLNVKKNLNGIKRKEWNWKKIAKYVLLFISFKNYELKGNKSINKEKFGAEVIKCNLILESCD